MPPKKRINDDELWKLRQFLAAQKENFADDQDERFNKETSPKDFVPAATCSESQIR
jgi:hypothetical protein